MRMSLPKLSDLLRVSLIYLAVTLSVWTFIGPLSATGSAREPQDQTEVIDEVASSEVYLEDEADLKLIVVLLIAFAFLAIFGLIYVVKSHRALSSNFKLIEQQRNKISDQNEALAFQNESLEELNIEKNNMLSVVAHDLKTPLGNIQGLVGLLLLDKPNYTKEQQEYMSIIKKVSQDALHMVNNMLNVHKIESELQQMTLGKYNLVDIVQAVVKLHEPLAATQQIQIEVVDDDKEYLAETDKQYFHQIISNILSNAVKFSPDGSLVQISFGDSGNTITVSVKDDGPGISAGDQKRLFSGYQKITSQTTGEEQSTGFGLAIVSRLVEKLQGKIKVDSAPNEGTVISVEIQKNTTE